MMTLGDRIKEKRLQNKMTLLEVANRLGVKEATVQRYESGEIKNLKQHTIAKLAEIFDTSPAYLMGWDEKNNILPEGAFEYKPTHKIPILGYISAGLPLYAEQHIEGYTYTELNGGAEYFGLIVKGDSMNAAMIYPGATLIVRRQESVENGEIAVVMVNDENATVKQFRRENDMVILEPKSTNPIHQTQIYSLKNTAIRIIGKVIEVKYTIQ